MAKNIRSSGCIRESYPMGWTLGSIVNKLWLGLGSQVRKEVESRLISEYHIKALDLKQNSKVLIGMIPKIKSITYVYSQLKRISPNVEFARNSLNWKKCSYIANAERCNTVQRNAKICILSYIKSTVNLINEKFNYLKFS